MGFVKNKLSIYLLLALLDVGIHDGGHDEAHDDYDGIPGGADEPHSLVQDVSASGLPFCGFERRRSPNKLEEIIHHNSF